ncbi:MAG: hypothetical protein QM726_22785 [Chitinophagaceae bacterium]
MKKAMLPLYTLLVIGWLACLQTDDNLRLPILTHYLSGHKPEVILNPVMQNDPYNPVTMPSNQFVNMPNSNFSFENNTSLGPQHYNNSVLLFTRLHLPEQAFCINR